MNSITSDRDVPKTPSSCLTTNFWYLSRVIDHCGFFANAAPLYLLDQEDSPGRHDLQGKYNVDLPYIHGSERVEPGGAVTTNGSERVPNTGSGCGPASRAEAYRRAVEGWEEPVGWYMGEPGYVRGGRASRAASGNPPA